MGVAEVPVSRATTRAAIQNWLAPPAISNLLAVHTAKPRNWKPTELQWEGARNSSAAGYVHIEGVREVRAATGKKHLEYTCALVFVFRSRHTGETGGEDRIADFDALVEGIKARLRNKTSGPLGGTQPLIFDCCEGLLEDSADLPQDQAAQSSIWAVVRFDVDEMITA